MALSTSWKPNRSPARLWCPWTWLRTKCASPHDNYPVADANGYYSYEKDVDLAKLEAKFKEVFNDQDLALDKRVVYIHGMPADLELPESVGGKINDHYGQHVTLPIAAGKINRVG